MMMIVRMMMMVMIMVLMIMIVRIMNEAIGRQHLQEQLVFWIYFSFTYFLYWIKGIEF